MPLDTPPLHLAEKTPPGGPVDAARYQKIEHLNATLRHHSAPDVIRAALSAVPNLALVSSFGADSVVLLHLTSMVRRDIPVLFIDTEMLFTETLVYQQEVAERLGLTNLRILRSDEIASQDSGGTLHRSDPDACCALRKTHPLAQALAPFDGWITGRKRFQSDARAALPFFEVEPGVGRIKVNPLAHWSATDIADYIAENRLPRHPLVARGYPSIGCAPCTSPVAPGETSRAGRWRNQTKEECGIHFVNGKLIRAGEQT